jgi:predicted RNase H-like HicB family nuclease
MSKFSVIIEEDEAGYYAYCPVLPSCQTQGDTFQEALDNIREAVELFLETLTEAERSQYLSRNIITAALEVKVA